MQSKTHIILPCDQIIEIDSDINKPYIFEDWMIKEYVSSRKYLENYHIEGKDKQINDLIIENEANQSKYTEVLVKFSDVLDQSWLNKQKSDMINKIAEFKLNGSPQNEFEKIMLETKALLSNPKINA